MILLVLLFLTSCTSCTHNEKTYISRDHTGLPTKIELRLNDDKGYLKIWVGTRTNQFAVSNISRDKSKLVLRKYGETFRATYEGDIKNNEIINFKSILGESIIWQCDLVQI